MLEAIGHSPAAKGSHRCGRSGGRPVRSVRRLRRARRRPGRAQRPIVEDAAEALGATLDGGRRAPSAGGGPSFNGNKVMTTSGGGMLLSDDAGLMTDAATCHPGPTAGRRATSTPTSATTTGCRNILAALGRAQLVRLDDMIGRRRACASRTARLCRRRSRCPRPRWRTRRRRRTTAGSPHRSRPQPRRWRPRSSSTADRRRTSRHGICGSRCTFSPSSPALVASSPVERSSCSPMGWPCRVGRP